MSGCSECARHPQSKIPQRASSLLLSLMWHKVIITSVITRN